MKAGTPEHLQSVITTIIGILGNLADRHEQTLARMKEMEAELAVYRHVVEQRYASIP